MMMFWLLSTANLAFASDPRGASRDGGQSTPEESELGETLPEDSDGVRVVGGEQAESGTWDDAAGVIVQASYVGCTGVLIAPRLALTAGHCVGGITHILLGSTDWLSNEGQFIAVERTIKYGDVLSGLDMAVMILAEEAPYAPRTIASDCILDDYLEDGAEVAVVGYGNTRTDGRGTTSRLNEGITTVIDADCSETYVDRIFTGCNLNTPGGELIAGGDGVDACFGDSGGPLYLLTDQGDFLVGITSRAMAGVPSNAPCGYGGIFGRPDAIIDWIEEESGMTVPRPQCNEAPDPKAARIETRRNRAATTRVRPNDPDGIDGEHDFEVVEKPRHGRARVNAEGIVTYTPDRGYTGEDEFTVAVTDAGSAEYPASAAMTAEIDVPVQVGGFGSGCSAIGTMAFGWLALLAAPLALIRRRR